ncbi:hypothetical protein [Halopseudomonas laoshanensis]|uniref:hypothetical protein n=1 Tax=Halopseudomonas laoshanensis TaxID=2268758 RepID=UPI002934A244|nr:hypothetical protein RPW65_13605 [Pseudomonas sp. NyZ704]
MNDRLWSLLQKAFGNPFLFPVTGFLVDPVVVQTVCVGMVYRHVKANPRAGRFVDGNLFHTSHVVGFAEHGEFVVITTLNSVYVCVALEEQRQELIAGLKVLPKLTWH